MPFESGTVQVSAVSMSRVALMAPLGLLHGLATEVHTQSSRHRKSLRGSSLMLVAATLNAGLPRPPIATGAVSRWPVWACRTC